MVIIHAPTNVPLSYLLFRVGVIRAERPLARARLPYIAQTSSILVRLSGSVFEGTLGHVLGETFCLGFVASEARQAILTPTSVPWRMETT